MTTLQGTELVEVTAIAPGGGPAATSERATVNDIASVGGTVATTTGTAYTPTKTDVGGYRRFTSASAVTVTIDTDANQPMPPNAVLTFEQSGAGTVTITAAGGVTINSVSGKVALNGQFAVGSLKRTAKDVWTLFGNLA